MALRTLVLREVCPVEQIFDFDYPMIAGHREEFERKFMLEFGYREINFLSFGQFKNRLEARLNTIMPHYLQLYQSEKLIDNPMQTYKIMESYFRENDNNIFKKSIAQAEQGETTLTRDSGYRDTKGSQDTKYGEQGETTGSLVRDTTADEKQTLHSDEKQTLHSDEHMEQEQFTDSDKQRELNASAKEVVKQTDKHTAENTEKNTQDTDGTSEAHKGYNEDTKGNKTTLFSDTPGKNFVIGDSNPLGQPISAYATTYTQENTTGNKKGTEDNDGKTHETQVQDKKRNENGTDTIDKTTDKTSKENEGTQFEENIDGTRDTSFDSERNTGFDSERNTHATGNQQDKTAGTHKVGSDDNVDYTSNEWSKGEQARNRETASLNTSASDRQDKGTVKYSKEYHGYKMHNESELLQAFRKTFLNIDRMIFGECETLFLGVYSLD